MSALLVLIYLAFISLGLPDSVLGSAWPSMHGTLGVPISVAGLVSMIITGGTIISSLNSARMLRRFGTGKVTLVSVGMTACALLGFSLSSNFYLVCLMAVPLGLGAGSVDSSLNHFVAMHFKASHMSWLHSFWGVGATLGPVIMSAFILKAGGWQSGYRAIGLIQLSLAIVLLIALPLWKQAKETPAPRREGEAKGLSLLQVLRLPKALPAIGTFFFYCSLESTVGLWGASYLVLYRGIAKDTAALWIALYYGGITLGRMLGGFLSLIIPQRKMIYLGLSGIVMGIICLLFPLEPVLLAGLFLIGLGCAPIFPAMLHETPRTFGDEHSQSLIGVQMAGAYLGSTMMPPLFGLLGALMGYGIMPAVLSLFFALMLTMIIKVYAGRKVIPL